MANQVSIKSVARKFLSESQSVDDFLTIQNANAAGKLLSYGYDFAIIKVFKDFEELLLNTIVGIINNEAPYVSDGHGGFRKKSLVKSQAETAFLGTKYFSFKGKNGLFKQIQGFIPASHWLRTILWDTRYNTSLALLIPLRNFAAHTSKNAKQKAIAAVGLTQLGQSGAWLKSSNRFQAILNDLNDIATRIRNQAHY